MSPPICEAARSGAWRNDTIHRALLRENRSRRSITQKLGTKRLRRCLRGRAQGVDNEPSDGRLSLAEGSGAPTGTFCAERLGQLMWLNDALPDATHVFLDRLDDASSVSATCDLPGDKTQDRRDFVGPEQASFSD